MTNTKSPTTTREPLELGGSVWLRSGTETLGGAARIALLAAIRDTGSITAAAKVVGMSYKAAWDAVDTICRRASRGERQRRHTTLTPGG